MKKLYITFLAVFFVSFVFAAVSAPVDLVFGNNASVNYDEGAFVLNWSSGAGDLEVNYTVFIFSNGTLFDSQVNDSITGYSFSNSTEANYSFIVQAENATGDLANSSQVYMQVDNSGPVIGLVGYSNATLKTDSDSLSLNISVVDGLSGETGSICLIDVNGTNQSVVVSSGWCNSSSISLVGAGDGNKTISVYVNDSIGNWNLNDSFVVWMDSTNPVATASCSSSSVYKGNDLSCTCSGSDSGSGINSSLTTANSEPSTSSTGTFTYTCSVTDNVGNSDSSVFEYRVRSRSGGGGSPTYYPDTEKMYAGYNIRLGEDYKVVFEFGNEEHVFAVDGILDEIVSLTVSSTPVSFEMSVGDVEKVDIDSDDRYDLEVELNGFMDNKADFVLTFIDEEVPAEEEVSDIVGEGVEEMEDEVSQEGSVGNQGGNVFWKWFFVFALVLVVVLILWKVGLFKNFNSIWKKFFKKSEYHKSFRGE